MPRPSSGSFFPPKRNRTTAKSTARWPGVKRLSSMRFLLFASLKGPARTTAVSGLPRRYGKTGSAADDFLFFGRNSSESGGIQIQVGRRHLRRHAPDPVIQGDILEL